MFDLPRYCRQKNSDHIVSGFFCVSRRSTVHLSVVFVVACFFSHAVSAQAAVVEETKPSIHLKGASFKSIDWSNHSAQAELSISVENPGPAFKIKDLSYRLKFNEKQAAEGTYGKQIEVPAHSSITFELPCTVDLSVMPGVAWSVIAGGFDVHYELETEFTVPLFPSFSPKLKKSITGDLSLTGTVSGWTARIKERIAGK